MLDAGRAQNQPTALDEKDLLIRLRDIQKRDSLLIPPTIYAFYDQCIKHYRRVYVSVGGQRVCWGATIHSVEEFMSLLTGLLSNIEKAKKLQEHT